MARTTPMKLLELMVMKDDIANVLTYLGKCGSFEFQTKSGDSSKEVSVNKELDIYKELDNVRSFLGLAEKENTFKNCQFPVEKEYTDANNIFESVKGLQEREAAESDANTRINESYHEALAFANLKASYSDLEHLSFLTLRIGKIDPAVFEELKFEAGSSAIVVQLGEDKTRILAATSKKGRFNLDNVLKKYAFVEMEVPQDFKGIPDDVLASLKEQKEISDKKLKDLEQERKNFCDTHKDRLYSLLESFSLASQVKAAENSLESTKLVYKISGWIPAIEAKEVVKHLEKISDNRIAITTYEPEEVPAVIHGKEKVPVELKHGKFVSSYKRMIFSYGSPIYGTIDPTPFVAVFFTILFGIMFGDAGQGLVFLIAGILMAAKVVKVGGWNKFAPIFMAIGITSMIMGVLTGEFFANEKVLIPVSRFITGLFGEPRDVILHMMPSSDPESIKRMFIFFGFSVAVGFVINTTGLILNIINNIFKKRWGKVFFGKNGLSGAVFFWYVIAFAVRIAAFGHSPAMYDWIIIGVSLFGAAFGEPLERLVDGERPVLENGFGSAVISGVVELIEVVSGYMSNTVSFLRVGAFALAHAVLGYIIGTMSEIAGIAGGLAISIIGNAIVVVLEGMIVAIQVIRLQYYEFFSKFFNETGREFKPFIFTDKPQM